jgi:hypothetical protein
MYTINPDEELVIALVRPRIKQKTLTGVLANKYCMSCLEMFHRDNALFIRPYISIFGAGRTCGKKQHQLDCNKDTVHKITAWTRSVLEELASPKDADATGCAMLATRFRCRLGVLSRCRDLPSEGEYSKSQAGDAVLLDKTSSFPCHPGLVRVIKFSIDRIYLDLQ